MRRAALLIAATSVAVLIGLADRAQAACEITGVPSSADLLNQYLGRSACTCSALNAICLQVRQGVDPRAINAERGFCAGSMRQCMRTGSFAYRTYNVVGAARQ